MIQGKPIPEEIKKKVIEIWKTTKDNTAPAIALKLGINPRTVNDIISKHLANKTLP